MRATRHTSAADFRPDRLTYLARRGAAFLLFAWCVTWITAALTPNLMLYPGSGAATPAAAGVVAARFLTQTPDQQCVDTSVFDAIADTFEVTASPLQPSACSHRTSRFAVIANLLEASGSPRPNSPAARALALPLQGHMMRLRI